MWEWLKTNSLAFQGFAGLVSPFLTAVIIFVTWRYVRLTRAIAETTHVQLTAQLQPVLTIGLRQTIFTSGINAEGPHFGVSQQIDIGNIGSTPVKIKSIYLVAQIRDGHQFKSQREYVIDAEQNLILLPQASIHNSYHVDTEIDYSGALSDMILGVRIDCTDLSELMTHSFYLHPTKGLRHSATNNPPMTLINILERASRYVKTVVEFEN
jgi:hypothetical protein